MWWIQTPHAQAQEVGFAILTLETSGMPILFKTRSIRKTSSHQHPPHKSVSKHHRTIKYNARTTERRRLLSSPNSCAWQSRRHDRSWRVRAHRQWERPRRRRLSHHGNPTRASRTSASGWHGHQPVTVVPDFHRLLTASGNNVEAAPWDKRRAYAEEWRGFTPRSTCRSQAKPGHLVLIKEIFISYSYVHLISGDGIFPLCQSAGSPPTVKPASSQVSPAPRCNRKVIE